MSIKIYVIEDQEIYSVAYKSIFSDNNGYELLGLSDNVSYESIKKAISKKSFHLIRLRPTGPPGADEVPEKG